MTPKPQSIKASYADRKLQPDEMTHVHVVLNMAELPTDYGLAP